MWWNRLNALRFLIGCTIFIGASVVAGIGPVGAALADVEKVDRTTDDRSEADAGGVGSSHTEIEPLIPKRDGQPGQLHTFKLDAAGNVVAGVRFDREYVQVYSPEFELVRELPLTFPATAIAIADDGSYVLGGGGKVAHISATGEMIKESPAPHLAGQSAEEAKEKMIAEYKKQMEEMREVYAQQIERMKSQIETLVKKKDEDAEKFSKRDETRLTALQNQLNQYETMIEQQFSVELNDQMLQYMIDSQNRIPSISVSGDDVFVAVSTGRTYQIWRVDSNLENGEQIISELSGCCGQFDFCARQDKLYLAENTKFQVGIYDRDGSHLTGFGSRAGVDESGFGSCCNPMNVICASNGDILTAESSIGKIKRFNQEGKLVSVVGKARIGGGCKHVALGFDEARDRYYIQYQDKHRICVLVPNHEAEKVMADSIANRQAAAIELARLEGSWEQVVGKQEEKPQGDSEAGTAFGSIVGADGESFSMDEYLAMRTNFERLRFDSKSKSVLCKFAAAKSSARRKLIESMLGGSGGQQPPVTYTTVPQSFQDGVLKLDFEDESGMIQFEVTVVQDSDSITLSLADDYSPASKSMVFKRAADTQDTTEAEGSIEITELDNPLDSEEGTE